MLGHKTFRKMLIYSGALLLMFVFVFVAVEQAGTGQPNREADR